MTCSRTRSPLPRLQSRLTQRDVHLSVELEQEPAGWRLHSVVRLGAFQVLLGDAFASSSVVEGHLGFADHLVHVEELVGDGAVDTLVLHAGHVELVELGQHWAKVAVAARLGAAHVVHLTAGGDVGVVSRHPPLTAERDVLGQNSHPASSRCLVRRQRHGRRSGDQGQQ